jgi:hypothetical protein
MSERQRIFVLRLQASANNAASTRSLRWMLKRLLRSYGLRCVSISVEEEPRPTTPDEVAT